MQCRWNRGRPPVTWIFGGLVAVAVLGLLPAGALGARPGSHAKTAVVIAPTNQAKLIRTSKVGVSVSRSVSPPDPHPRSTGKPHHRRVVKLALSLKQGARPPVKVAKTASIKGKGYALLFLRLNPNGRRLVQSCIPTDVRAVARNRAGKKLGQDTARIRRDPARCNGSKPTGVDLANSGRCDFIAAPGQECLFPYPNDYFTRKDPATDTGLRLNLDRNSTPANSSDVHVDPADLNTSDGFSPGALIVLHVPGLDDPAAFANTRAVPITRQGAYDNASQAVVLIDAQTGKRQPIWTELDSNASSPETTGLLIHPAKNLTDGHRYIVAMRHLKDAAGKKLAPPEGFRIYRDAIPTSVPVIENRRKHFESLFKTLGGAEIQRKNLYLAWDFTVASTRNISERMLDIRDRGLAALGDTTPGDGIRQGHAPTFNITSVTDYPLSPVPTSGRGVEDIRQIEGTIDVPCYLNQVGCPSDSRFNLDSNGLPQRIPGNTYQARFGCNIPRSAVQDNGSGGIEVANAALPTMYGHGLFGTYNEGLRSQNVRQLGTENNVIVCSADFIGMADEDVIPEALPALLDMSNFEPLPDRLQQGFLDFVYLGRALSMPDGFASDPAFKFGGQSALDPSSVSYYGNSQGGIAGGALTAIEPDVTRSVLYVPGMNYGGLLLTRSVDFPEYAQFLYPAYPDEARASAAALDDPVAVGSRRAERLRQPHDHRSPAGTPAAQGDARDGLRRPPGGQRRDRGRGADDRRLATPARRSTPTARRPGFNQPLFGIPTLGRFPGRRPTGNGDVRLGHRPEARRPASSDPNDVLGTDPPPNGNTAPDDSYGVDPHDTVIEYSPLIRHQIAEFIKPGGAITDPCGANPCYAAGYNGSP